MATLLLRTGRLASLKLLHSERWAVLRSRPAAPLCTQPEEPPHTPRRKPSESKKAAAAAAAEPEEPYDGSTYKNLQHHSYNPFTFADLDVEMAKYRLPQPSAGRH